MKQEQQHINGQSFPDLERRITEQLQKINSSLVLFAGALKLYQKQRMSDADALNPDNTGAQHLECNAEYLYSSKLSDQIIEQGERAKLMIREYLGYFNAEPSKFNVKDLIHSVADPSIVCHNSTRDCCVSLELGDNFPTVIASQSHFIRIFNNLVINALKHSEATKITIDYDPKTREYSVKDNGIGIPEESIDMIFDEGCKLEKSSGTGIGLYSVKMLVLYYGGSVYARSTLGEGTDFRFTLPLANNPTSDALDPDAVRAVRDINGSGLSHDIINQLHGVYSFMTLIAEEQSGMSKTLQRAAGTLCDITKGLTRSINDYRIIRQKYQAALTRSTSHSSIRLLL